MEIRCVKQATEANTSEKQMNKEERWGEGKRRVKTSV